MNRPTCMYPTEQPGIRYAKRLLELVDEKFKEIIGDIPDKLMDQYSAAMQILKYSEHLNIFDDVLNDAHHFFILCRGKIIAACNRTKTEREIKKQKEREAYIARRDIATIPGHEAATDAIYTQSRALAIKNNEKYHVDHIVPLFGMWRGEHVVCGLHYPANLQILPKRCNLNKGNTFQPGVDS